MQRVAHHHRVHHRRRPLGAGVFVLSLSRPGDLRDVPTIQSVLRPAPGPAEGPHGGWRPHAPGRRRHPRAPGGGRPRVPAGGVPRRDRGEAAQAAERGRDAGRREPRPRVCRRRLGRRARCRTDRAARYRARSGADRGGSARPPPPPRPPGGRGVGIRATGPRLDRPPRSPRRPRALLRRDGGVPPGRRGRDHRQHRHGRHARSERPQGPGRADVLVHPALRQPALARELGAPPSRGRPRALAALRARRPTPGNARGQRLGRLSRCGRGGAPRHAPGDRRAAVRQWRLRGEGGGSPRRPAPRHSGGEGGRRHRRRGLPPRADRPMSGTLRLDRNEGPPPSPALLEALAGIDPEALRRYREVSGLEAALADRFDVQPDRVIVTAGADEAIERACRACLGRGRTILLPEPTFEMLDHFAALAGGRPTRVPWPAGPFPIDGFLARLDAHPALIAVVSPNNPTGAVACADDVRRLAAAAPEALVLLDHAYVEYADADLTAAVADLANVLVIRTLSKAWGLAGCRVGYAIGSPTVVAALRAAGGPYTVAAPSVALALTQISLGETAVRDHVARVREERRSLGERLAALGVEPLPSQANFVYVDCGPRAPFLAAALRALGVLVRDFPGRARCETALRITLPGDEAEFAQLVQALETALAPQALLLDLDGVLADVRDSQRAAIAATAAALGVSVTAREVAAAIHGGDAANDWTVTRRLVESRGERASLEDVTARYQG